MCFHNFFLAFYQIKDLKSFNKEITNFLNPVTQLILYYIS